MNTTDTAKTPTVTQLPRESVLSVHEGATAFTGVLTGIRLGDFQGGVIAKDTASLEALFSQMVGNPKFDKSLVHPVVIVHRDSAKLDDEL